MKRKKAQLGYGPHRLCLEVSGCDAFSSPEAPPFPSVTVASVHPHPYIQAGETLRAVAGRSPAVFPFRSRSPNPPFTGAISTVAKSTGAFSRGKVLTLCAWEQVQVLCSKPGLRMEPRAKLSH